MMTNSIQQQFNTLQSPHVAFLGECMLEFYQQYPQQTGFGGDTLNTALYLKRLLQHQVQVSFVTALGDEPESERLLTAWHKEGVATQWVLTHPEKSTGRYWIDTDDQGERTFRYQRSDSAARYWLELEQSPAVCEQLIKSSVIYLSGISLAILSSTAREQTIELLQKAQQQGSLIIFDNNLRPALWENLETARYYYKKVLNCTNLALLTLDDDELLWGFDSPQQSLEFAASCGVTEVVVRCGAQPCWLSAQGETQQVAAEPVSASQVVDTTAAGDSFSAGYLSGRLQGESPEESARRGHALAATVIQHQGAVIPIEVMPKMPHTVKQTELSEQL